MDKQPEYPKTQPIHEWFGLSYASYLVLPRSVLQSMPDEWQSKLVELLDQIDSTLDICDFPKYRVKAVTDNSKFTKCPFQNYERGRRQLPFKPSTP